MTKNIFLINNACEKTLLSRKHLSKSSLDGENALHKIKHSTRTNDCLLLKFVNEVSVFRKILRRNTILLIFLLPLSSFAQEDSVGNWLMYFGTNRFSEKFSFHTEIQHRNHTLKPNNIEQLLLRVGLNYHFDDKAAVTAGYAYISSYDFDSEQNYPESEEHRIWQQFILTNNLSRVKFEHRYRIEQRWVNQDFKSRFRYRLMLFIPLNNPVIEPKTLFIGLYDEIFINATEPFFDRNRLYGALGYQFNKAASLQVGMMHQQVRESGKWYLQFAFFYNPDLRKKIPK